MSDNTQFTATNPNFETDCRESFGRQSIMNLLGATMRTIEPGRCVIDLPFRENLVQQDIFFHGGVTATIADSAGGYASLTLMPPDSRILTVEFKINFLRAADGDSLTADGRVIKAGNTLTVTQIEVTTRRKSQDILCAIMQQTAMRVADPNE